MHGEIWTGKHERDHVGVASRQFILCHGTWRAFRAVRHVTPSAWSAAVVALRGTLGWASCVLTTSSLFFLQPLAFFHLSTSRPVVFAHAPCSIVPCSRRLFLQRRGTDGIQNEVVEGILVRYISPHLHGAWMADASLPTIIEMKLTILSRRQKPWI